MPLIILIITAGVLVLLWRLLRPGGLLEEWGRLRLMSGRILMEDALKYIHACEYERRPADRDGLVQSLRIPAKKADQLISRLKSHGLLTDSGKGLRLSQKGRDHAVRIIRAHRIWERYLADETGLDEASWHRHAHRREHSLTAEEVDSLAADLGNPAFDPHGDPIPTATGELPPHNGQPLTTLAPGEWAVVVHVEDEPELLYEQLVAAGVHPGMQIQLLESGKRIRIWTRNGEQILAPPLAALVSVVPLAEETDSTSHGELLADLKPGEKAVVTAISPACRKQERRRLMDLGILPGTTIEAVMRSPAGDPTAYRVRGTLIALRKEQSRTIYISRGAQEAA